MSTAATVCLARPDDLIGLIDFGGYVEVKCPLTLDHGALQQLLDTVKIAEPTPDAAGRVDQKLLQEDQSTAIGDSLATAVDRLKTVKAKSKIIILLSDGVSNAGVLPPEEAAQIAKTFGIKVYTIGIGSSKPVTVPVKNLFGQTVMMPVKVEFDERAFETDCRRDRGGNTSMPKIPNRSKRFTPRSTNWKKPSRKEGSTPIIATFMKLCFCPA